MSDMFGQFIAAGTGGREPRQRRLILASMSFDRIADQEMVIRNVSKLGLGGATQGVVPAEGKRISVKLPNENTIYGVVRWADGPCFGLELESELYPDAIADVKMRLGTARPVPGWEVARLHRVITPRVEVAALRRV